MGKNGSAGAKKGVPTSDHLDVPDVHNEHHDEQDKVGNHDPDTTPHDDTFSTHEIHELHTWHSDQQMLPRNQSAGHILRSDHFEYLKS